MQVVFELRCPISADLGFIRDLIRMHGHHSGLRDPRLDNLVLAVNEAVTNVLDHAGTAGLITARTTSESVTVEILDTAGRLTHGHLAAAHEIDGTATHGYGLWVIQRLCDVVHLEQTGHGSRLSLEMRRHSPRRIRPVKPFRTAALLSHL
ncbi:ATP-binding protein [Nonomuraea zeae]|uniref:ATP-binding protein n=1 Tax=Nonomuraea zeae TaxID=1642303 RepID=A0A5S4GP74_9ACTN|nr:ATP-binding protein [Nonomuraea zeae]TMR34756.1 ATP-binding protein [Nonomuraea zeae]